MRNFNHPGFIGDKRLPAEAGGRIARDGAADIDAAHKAWADWRERKGGNHASLFE